MNRQIARLAVLGLVLLAALIVGTTYWQTWATAGLANRQDNEIARVAQFSIERGLIRAANGMILARNKKKRVDGQTLYFRRYPQGGLFAQVVGYSTQSRSRSGLEESENDYLTGANASLKTIVDKMLNKLRGETVKGNDLWLTLRPSAQRVAMSQLAGKCGAAVALDPRTGAVLAMASQPTYNPNLVESNFSAITRIRSSGCSPASPLLNRATDDVFTPGSSFKVVTATAAIDSGRYNINSRFDDKGYCIEYGQKVHNFADQGRVEVFGSVDFLQALENSINAVFCNIGLAIGERSILNAAKRFGFYKDPPLETPASERVPSGLYNQHNKLFDPTQPQQVDVGRLAFGQGPATAHPLVTPLQMAMVAAGVANHGVVMRPYVVGKVTAPDGSVVARTHAHEYKQAMKRSTADQLNEMMQAVVTGGTGTLAQIPGIKVAGKTGTAETGGPGTPNTTWFIAFAPANAPRVAVAVVLQNQTGAGGTTAAPIAKAIMEALLTGGSNS